MHGGVQPLYETGQVGAASLRDGAGWCSLSTRRGRLVSLSTRRGRLVQPLYETGQDGQPLYETGQVGAASPRDGAGWSGKENIISKDLMVEVTGKLDSKRVEKRTCV